MLSSSSAPHPKKLKLEQVLLHVIAGYGKIPLFRPAWDVEGYLCGPAELLRKETVHSRSSHALGYHVFPGLLWSGDRRAGGQLFSYTCAYI